MSYEGLEIDMINLGDADSILVSLWGKDLSGKQGVRRILIDGGNPGDTDKVLAFLEARGATYLEHIVCSHPHEDHAGGLAELVKNKRIDFGYAWVHCPWLHINEDLLNATLGVSAITAKRVVNIVKSSVQFSRDFVNAVTARGKGVFEPFDGHQIGFLWVCGPTKEYYEQLLMEFTDLDKIKGMEEAMIAHENSVLMENVLGMQGTGLGGAPTAPENNSSTILWTRYGQDGLLFTADAGVEALTAVKQKYWGIGGLRWMQIPHHGSRRNVNNDLINFFKPKTAFVSADGNKKHPRLAVVNAFKATGSEVFSTHYPNSGGNIWFPLGSVPLRPEYRNAIPLYEAEKQTQSKS